MQTERPFASKKADI